MWAEINYQKKSNNQATRHKLLKFKAQFIVHRHKDE